MSKNPKHKKSTTASTLSSFTPISPPGASIKHHKSGSFADSFKKLIDSISKPSIDLEQINHDSPDQHEPRYENVQAKARELKYKIQEWILMKSIIFSLVVFLVFVVLLHFVLNLAGGYIPVLTLSILASTALIPTKDALSSKLKNLLGITQVQNQEKYFFQTSLLFLTYKAMGDLLSFKKSLQLTKKRKQKITAIWKHFSLTGDIYAILLISICYFLISKFGAGFVLLLIGVILLLDFIVKLFMDSITLLINQFSWFRNIKHSFQKNKDISSGIDSLVATSVLFGFMLFSVGIFLFLFFFLLMDLETIFMNLGNSITTLIQTINARVSEYSGVENAINTNFVDQFMKNYNETIYSYFENQELKGMYLLFSGALNSWKSNTAGAGSSLRDLPSLVVENVVENSTEFQHCMSNSRLNFDFDFLHNLERMYCSILPYTKGFSIDPYTTIKKIKDGVEFVFHIVFGTILVEVFMISKAALDYLFNVIIFCFCVYYLLHANKSVIHTITGLLPLNPKVQTELNTSLVRSIKGSFLCSIKIFIYHFVFTWLLFDIFKLKLGFTISMAAAVFSILPFIPTWCLCVPHAIYIYLIEDSFVNAFLLIFIYVMISNKVFNDIYKKSVDVHPYVTGLSIVMGIYAFDTLGIIYGPILMCATSIVMDLVQKYGINTDSMVTLYKRRIYDFEELENLKEMGDRSTKRRSKSFREAPTPTMT